MKKLRFALVVLLAATLACNLPLAVATSTPTQETNLPPTEPAEAPIETEAPPTDTQPDTSTPDIETDILPAGIAVLPTTSEPDSVTIYDRSGSNLGSLPTPGMFARGVSELHIFGHLNDGVNALSAVYFSLKDGEEIRLSTGGNVTTLTDFPAAMGMAGVPGEPWVAYSQLEYTADKVRSYLYVGEISEIANLTPIYTIDDPEGWTIKPLALDFVGENVTGVYFTYIPWGIGGDIVFEPRQGIFYLDIATREARPQLSRDFTPWDFDPNLPLYAITNGYANPMIIAQSTSGPSVEVPLQADSDRGAGDGFIAPDGQHVAWKEGSGYQMAEQPNFYATIRIADTQGSLLTSFPNSSLGLAAGFSVGYVRPVGWLDAHTLLIQVRGDDWENAAVLKYDITTLSASYYTSGNFVGFVYP